MEDYMPVAGLVLLYVAGLVSLVGAVIFAVRGWRANERRIDALAKEAAIKAEARRIEEDLRLRRCRYPLKMAAEFQAIGDHKRASAFRAEHRRRLAERDAECASAVLVGLDLDRYDSSPSSNNPA